MNALGTVSLVGAGPGDPDLLTVKARRLIAAADAVVHDRLVSSDILALIPASADRFDVGKQAGRHPTPQGDINQLLIRLAARYRRVVRLKGGDPFMFGRGGEEAAALAQAGVPFEIVPGITSAQGCAAALAVPLTHRGAASGVRYITGHCREDADLDFDWAGLADPATTLVVYMGLATIERIAAELIRHGLDPQTPAAAVNNGTLASERHVVAPLRDIAAAARAAAFAGPVLFIIGEVVSVGLSLGTLRRDTPSAHLLAAQ